MKGYFFIFIFHKKEEYVILKAEIQKEKESVCHLETNRKIIHQKIPRFGRTWKIMIY